MLLCMLEAVEGVLCLLDVLEIVCYVLLCMLEAVEICVLCAGGRGGYAQFAGGAEDDVLYAALCA